MTPDIQQATEEGRLAFVQNVPLSGNPYSTTYAAPLAARLLDLAWSHGWLLAEAAVMRADSAEVLAKARAVRRSR